MKRLFILLLGVAVVASLGLIVVACGSGAVTTDKALEHEGKSITMTGEVVGVEDLGETIAKVVVHLDSAVDGEGANVGVMYEDIEAMGDAVTIEWLKALEGKTIEITGVVEINQYEGKPEIPLTSADQLVIK